MGRLWEVVTRRKRLDPCAVEDSRLARVLDACDLTALGVGSTLGVGVYVLAGQVAKDAAGPAVTLSFLLAAVASVFAGLCYAEFGARIPKAGSAYTYSYVSMGEFIAFIIGWNLILEYVIGSASVVRGLSMYMDSMMNDTMKKAFISFAPINVPILSPYFDLFAFVISLVLAVVLAVGVKESSYINSLFTLVNIVVILFVIIVGSVKADAANWKIRREDIPDDVNGGEGGFLPFGIAGVLKGAATCFYGFVGFDCIATTGEEVKKPQRAIPLAILLSLMIVFLSYFGISTVLTMMVPYYEQDEDAPIPHVFMSVGWPVAKWIVSVGGIFGLCASLFGSMFPLPRIIYAMATDGLLFRFLGMVNSRLHTPIVATLLAGVLTGLMGGLFELSHLVNMMSIGTLLAYTIVAACVLLLRYSGGLSDDGYMLLVTYCENFVAEGGSQAKDAVMYTNSDNEDDQDGLLNTTFKKSDLAREQDITFSSVAMQLFNIPRVRSPTSLTSNIVVAQVSLFCVMCVVTSQSVIQLMDHLTSGSPAAITAVALEVFVGCLIVVSITLQPKSTRHLPFRVPFVPLLPALSIFINIYLMMMLDVLTWIRFAVWMAIGVVFYLIYGCWKSEERDAGKVRSVGCPSKAGVGHVNEGYVPSEASSDPEATPEVSQKTDKSAHDDAKAATTPRSDGNHVPLTRVDNVARENHVQPPQVCDTLLGRAEREANDVAFVNKSERNVKNRNLRVLGGDSIRSYVSVRDGAVNSARGGGTTVVFPSAFVSSECACLDDSLKDTQPKDEGNITVIPGFKVSRGGGSDADEEKNLYPNIIVLPFGAEMTAEEQSLNETSDHENSKDSDSEEYCTPESDEPDDSTQKNSFNIRNSSHADNNMENGPDKQSYEETKVLPSEDLQESALTLKDKTDNDTSLKNESETPSVTDKKDPDLGQGGLRSSSFTEKLNTLLKKQHGTKAKQLQVNYGERKDNHNQLVARTESNQLHEKLKKTSSVDSRHIDVSFSIKDRLEMLLAQRLVGTIAQPDSGYGSKQSANVYRTKSHENLVTDFGGATRAEEVVPVSQRISNENLINKNIANGTENAKISDTEPYTKDEMRAKLEDIFSRKQRPSFRTRPETTAAEITMSDNAETAGKHKLLTEVLISGTGKETNNTNTNELDKVESLVATDISRSEQNISEKSDFPPQNQVKNVDDHLEDSDNSELYFDALNKPDLDHPDSR